MLIYKQVFFFLSLPLCVYHPPLIFNEVLKWGRKKREYLSCFYLFICGTLYIDWKSHLLCIIRGHPILLSHNENWFNSPQLLCVKLDREIERDRKKKSVQPISSLYFRVENTMRQMEMATSSLKTETTIALSQSMDSVNTNPEEEVSACQLFIFQTPPPLLQNFAHLSPFPHPQTKKKIKLRMPHPYHNYPPKKMRSKIPPSYCQFHPPAPSHPTPPPSNSPHPCCTITPLPWKKSWGYCITYL